MTQSKDEVPDVKAAAASAIVALAGVAGLGQLPSEVANNSQPPLRSQMLVSTEWLQAHLHDRDMVILQVGRSSSEYAAGHIPGSRFLPFDELVEQHTDSLNDLPGVAALQALFEGLGVGDGDRVVLYGEGGGLLAARAYFTLDYLGHGDRAALLDGGMEKWKAEGREISDQVAHPTTSHFTAHARSDVLITTAAMRQISQSMTHDGAEDYVLLDARPPREFEGLARSEGVSQAGHIPGARSLPWKELLRSQSVPALLDPGELREVFARAGAEPGKLVVTYCRTGMQSSFTYFVARYLGYRAAMYDGSVYQWVNRNGNRLVVENSAVQASSGK